MIDLREEISFFKKLAGEVRKIATPVPQASAETEQISSAEVVQRLVEIARSLREAGRRHEQLGLTAEEAAFYDALASGADAPNVDPQLATIARDLIKSIREDLTVDWADRASTEAAIRPKIRRLLREHEYKPPVVAPTARRGRVLQETALPPNTVSQPIVHHRRLARVEIRLHESGDRAALLVVR